MAIEKANTFYNNDKKDYLVLNNKKFLSLFKSWIKSGYNPYLELEEIQKLINFIYSWYEIKYPEREFDYLDGIRCFDFYNIKSLKKQMSIEQLMYRLSHEQLASIQCLYRSRGSSLNCKYDKQGNIIDFKADTYMSIKRKNVKIDCCSLDKKIPKFLVRADDRSGIVSIDYNITEFTDNDNITLDELLDIFDKNYANELDFSELRHCVYLHNCDLELRKIVLQMVALRLLYSKETIPERGYERARRFINEFNKKLNLNIDLDQIDKIADEFSINKEAYSKKGKTRSLTK